MLKISDFPYAKIDDIGVKFIDQIVTYCKKFKVEMNNFNATKNSDHQGNSHSSAAKPVI